MITIRQEEESDRGQIYAVQEAAFQRNSEAELVDRLRLDCGRDCLSLVACDRNRIVGHALFTPVEIGSMVSGRGLGPVAVNPDKQRQGVGTKLIEWGIDYLQEQRCPFVVVLGHPNYYPRFGFEPASRFNVRCQWDRVPDEAFMVLRLSEQRMQGVSGIVRYHRAFAEVS